MKAKFIAATLFSFLLVFGWSSSWAQTVKVTPLGAEANRFCVGDRAILFEDPTGVRVLIAPGRTVGKDTGAFVTGSADDRLKVGGVGVVHVLLIDHPHVDHIGDVFHLNCAGSSTCFSLFPLKSNTATLIIQTIFSTELPDAGLQT